MCGHYPPQCSIIIFIIYLFRFVWASPLSLSCFLINYCWSSPTSQIVLMVEIKQRQELHLTLFIFQAFSDLETKQLRALYGRGLAKQRDALFYIGSWKLLSVTQLLVLFFLSPSLWWHHCLPILSRSPWSTPLSMQAAHILWLHKKQARN